MQHFYFDVQAGNTFTRDDSGLDFETLDGAMDNAFESLSDFAREQTFERAAGQDIAVVVRDECGTHLGMCRMTTVVTRYVLGRAEVH